MSLKPIAKQESNINFELYKFFYHAASLINFSKAAEKLHVTQSAVSQAIKSLEEQLGINLFYRQGRHIRLTYEGELLFEHIEKAYHFIIAAENTLSSIKSLDEGTIFIGASDTISRYYLIRHIKAFNSQYPKVKIAINNRPSPRSVELLNSGQIDLAVINMNPNLSYDTLNQHAFTETENIFICHPAREDLIHHTVSLKKLNTEPLVCLEPGSTTRRILHDYYEKHQLSLSPSFEFGSFEVILEAVKANMGIGFISRIVAQEAIDHGEICEIKTIEKIPATKIGILTNKSKPLSLAAQTFLTILSGLENP